MRPGTALALAVAVAFDTEQPVHQQVAAASSSIPDTANSPSTTMRWSIDEKTAAPPDVTVELTEAPNALRLVLRRPRYIVALRTADRVEAAEDWVSAGIEGLGGRELGMEWETTDPRSLDTVRGGLWIAAGPEGPTVTWFGLPEPVVVASHQEHLHTCRALGATGGGFTILCRVARSARKLSVTNVTDESLLSNVWMSAGAAHIARLDLPLGEGDAPARLMGYVDGVTAVVVRAEASWVRGEEHPTLALFAATRRQPVVATFRARR